MTGSPRTRRRLLSAQRQQLVEVALGGCLVDPLDLAAGSVREPDPGHPPLFALVPPHRRALRHSRTSPST
jgi:hypothetical protein